MSKTFFLIRHGPTHEKRFVGHTDVPADLSNINRLTAMKAALPSDVNMISSDLLRARTTADALQSQHTRLPDDPRLREIHFGEWEGKTWDEIHATYPDLARRYFEQPSDIAPPHGESWNDLRERVDLALDKLDQTSIIVAHMGVILAVLQRSLNCSPYEAMSHKIDPLSITTIEIRGDKIYVKGINHLL